MKTSRRILLSVLIPVVVLSLVEPGTGQVFKSKPAAAESTQQTIGGAPQMHQDQAVQQTGGWPSLPLPKISMPKIPMPKIAMPDFSPITSPIKSGFGKVSSGTKNAWEGTKEMFTFGNGETHQTEAPPAKPTKQGFWGRLFSPEPEKPDGPQTVAEWMAQPRVDH